MAGTSVAKERPILFSGPMVRGIIAGNKTQTRRIVKGTALSWLTESEFTSEFTAAPENGLCPYGYPGDRLWVRETWAEMVPGHHQTRVAYRADMVVQNQSRHVRRFGSVQWPLDGSEEGQHPPARWRPSIHMPRWASRLTLEITAVRAERLQEISEDDILAEGVTVDLAAKMTGIPWSSLPTLHHAWTAGWDFINGKRAPWASNPWVWVIEFKVAPHG